MVHPPQLLRYIYPGVLWNYSRAEKKLYLTFDDGPITDITPQVLDLLRQYDAKATFFCIGENVKKNPDIFSRIISEGHSIGNHTWSHLNCWKVKGSDYIDDISKAAAIIKTKLFRPPYGTLTPSTIFKLKNHYQIIMWDVISYDFDKSLTKEKVLENVYKHTREGSIIVFHDSMKASEKMLYVLPQVLSRYSKEGFTFERI